MPIIALCLGLAYSSSVPAAGADLDVARQLGNAFADVAERVSPTVVVINVKQKPMPVSEETDDEDGSRSLPPGFWHRFHDYFRRSGPLTSQGSGIIVRPDGYIMTNGHVVEDADTIEVSLQDGRKFRANVRGVDAQSDVAVLKIEAKDLPCARFADSSKTRVGEFAIAVGTPFSLDYSFTFGHVSAKSRSNVLEGYEGVMMDQDFIQTDALINPGNSGGPLVNIDGEVIGINTLIKGLHTGIGFAVPSNLAKEVSDQLIAEGKFTRAWLGVSIGALRDDTELERRMEGVKEGVIVSRILADGPAAKSELKSGDVITAIDGRPVSTPQQLRGEIRGKKIGQPVVLTVFRKSNQVKVEVTPGEWVQAPPPVAKMHEAPPTKAAPVALGVNVKPLTPEVATRLGLVPGTGVLISSVEKNSPASRKGLEAGDVITALDEKPVSNPEEFKSALQHADLTKGVLVNFVSGSTQRFEILKAQP